MAGEVAGAVGVADGVNPAGSTDEDADVEKYVWGAGDVVWQAPAVADPAVDKYVWQLPDVVWDSPAGESADGTDAQMADGGPYLVCIDCGEPITFAGKPCGASFISPGKTCRIGGARAFTDGEDFASYFGERGGKASAEQAKAIEHYGADGYKTMNAGLRGDGKLGAADRKAVAALDDYIAGAPPLDEDVVLFRGGSLPAGMKKGAEFTDAGFASVSGDVNVADNFVRGGNVMIQVRVPAGSRVLPVGAAMGGRDFESEVILGRNTRYRLVGTGKVKRQVQSRSPSGRVSVTTKTVKTIELEVIP